MIAAKSFFKRIYRAMCPAAFSLLAPVGSTLATELPRFDGVYIQNRGGVFTELQPVSFENFNVCNEQGYVGPLKVANPNQIASADRMVRNLVRSIFIRSREERLTFVSWAVPVNSFLSPFRDNANAVLTTPHQVLGPCERSGIFPREIQQIDFESSSVADANCGYGVDRFRVLSEFENTAEYYEREDVDLRFGLGAVIGECAGSDTITPVGLFIHTNLNKYFIGYW